MDIKNFFEVLGILFAEKHNVKIKSIKVDKVKKGA